jgi:hypothetical protein
MLCLKQPATAHTGYRRAYRLLGQAEVAEYLDKAGNPNLTSTAEEVIAIKGQDRGSRTKQLYSLSKLSIAFFIRYKTVAIY